MCSRKWQRLAFALLFVINVLMFICHLLIAGAEYKTRGVKQNLAQLLRQDFGANQSTVAGSDQRNAYGKEISGEGNKTHPSRESAGNLSPFQEKEFAVIYPESLPYKDRSVDEVKGRLVPNVVHYVWCGQRIFQFRHYLSVMSIYYTLEPDLIQFLYEFPPKQDLYNDWFTRLRTHLPIFSDVPLPSHIRGNDCGAAFGLEVLHAEGGVYVSETTLIWADAYKVLLTHPITLGLGKGGHNLSISIVASVARNGDLKHLMTGLHNSGVAASVNNATRWRTTVNSLNVTTVHLVRCEDLKLYGYANEKMHYLGGGSSNYIITKSMCFNISKPLTPKDFLKETKDENSVTTFLKRLSGEPKKGGGTITKSSNSSIPSIVHYVWFGAQTMTFSMYLSFLSTAYIVKPLKILIHGDLGLTGPYWNVVKAHPLVTLVYRERPKTIFGHRILYRQHTSDVVRADVLDKYGGMYLDWDAFWLKSPKPLLHTVQEVVLSRDHMPHENYPDTINMGVALAKPRSKFIRAWRAALVNYKPKHFLYNAVYLPYKVYEMFPTGVLVHDHLQVMCYYLKCHPTFDPQFRHWDKAQPFNWTTDVYAIHFTHPDPPAFKNESALMTSSGMFADIGRYILGLRSQAHSGASR